MKKTSKSNTTKPAVSLYIIKTRNPEKGIVVHLRSGEAVDIPGATDVIIDNIFGRLHIFENAKTIAIFANGDWVYFRTYAEGGKK